MATLDNIPIHRMHQALVEAQVPLVSSERMDVEEWGNYIIDKFDTFIIGYTYGYEAKCEFTTTICHNKNGYLRRQYEWRMTQ